MDTAVDEVVRRQRRAGIDIASDGQTAGAAPASRRLWVSTKNPWGVGS